MYIYIYIYYDNDNDNGPTDPNGLVAWRGEFLRDDS